LLKTEKWISKIDFIFLLKMHCDSAQERHGRVIHFFYQLHFSQVKKDSNGRMIFQ
jgi:hypothetical protein